MGQEVPRVGRDSRNVPTSHPSKHKDCSDGHVGRRIPWHHRRLRIYRVTRLFPVMPSRFGLLSSALRRGRSTVNLALLFRANTDEHTPTLSSHSKRRVTSPIARTPPPIAAPFSPHSPSSRASQSNPRQKRQTTAHITRSVNPKQVRRARSSPPSHALENKRFTLHTGQSRRGHHISQTPVANDHEDPSPIPHL